MIPGVLVAAVAGAGCLPGPHVDTLVGEAVLLGDREGRRLVLGIDRLDRPGGTDGRMDHVILFAVSRLPETWSPRKGRAHVQVWHEGLRVEFPEEQAAFDLTLAGATPPAAHQETPFPIERIAGGLGMSKCGGPMVEALGFEELKRCPLKGALLKDGGAPIEQR